MTAEKTQELGREGVFMFKRWLESTTYFDLPWNVYHNNRMCEVRYKAGPQGIKYFDIAGHFLHSPPTPVYVEGKRYSSVGKQNDMFLEMVAIAYGSYRYEKENGSADSKQQYIFATTHPFSVTNWNNLISLQTVEEAFKRYPDIVGSDPFNPSYASIIQDRIWIIVWSKRQEEISLQPDELMSVWSILKRKENQN